MQLKTFSTCLACALLLMGCSPKDYTFSMAQDWRHDSKLQNHFQQLTQEDQGLFTAYTERIEQGGPAAKNAAGMISIGEAISLQAQWQRQHVKIDAIVRPTSHAAPPVAQDDETAHIQLLKEMRSVVTPSAMSFKYSKDSSVENWDLAMSFKNNGSLKVSGIEGTIVVRDAKGIEQKRSSVQSDMTIEPGAVMSEVWRLDCSSEDPGDLALKKADVKKLVFSWYPSTYRFADGTTLTLVK
ncbi:hypothetical protein J3D48_006119 [Pseudomonas fluorescens]|uniref:hypothetical protein n=1 Tax=Pseudomonas fluorescens TaxID=294 RepID=UPI00209DB493|nr:hypothetical protein [Pseudomonas fluorescens]MCP1489709.1 hypothetical protein [Pseudomonas fluorescens]